MHAGPTLRRLGRRLALVTCVSAVVAAALSGPAMADPGGLLTGVTESLPLPPVVAEPVEDVGSTVDQLVEQVQDPVDATVQDVTELVDETVSGVEEAVVPTVAVSETGTPAASPTAEPTEGVPAVPTTDAVVLPETETIPQPQQVPLTVAAERVDAPSTQSGGTTFRPSAAKRPTGPVDQAAATAAAVTVTREEVPAAAGTPRRDGTDAPASPQPRFFADLSVFGGSVPQPPAPALLIALLLGALALAAPRAGGPRLHPAVALPHPADVRFRLVRPG